MKVDPYAPCPGGCDKKIKFCDSCKNHLGDLEKISKLLVGDQRAACLDLCEKVDEKTPNRACVLSIKAVLESQLGMKERANRTIANFLKLYPENPVALSEKAIQNASEGLLPLAVETLQTALYKCDEVLPGRVIDAIRVVGRTLLAQGDIRAARGHLLLELGFAGDEDLMEDEDALSTVSLLMRINHARDVPLMLKEDAFLKPCDEDSPQLDAFEDAIELAARGAWRAAEHSFHQLASKAPTMPALWHNLAVLRGWLADQEGSVTALRKFAALEIPLDEAVEAEALAQLLDRRSASADEVELVQVEYDVSNLDQFLAALTASQRTVPIHLPARFEVAEVPPHAAYVVLDRDQIENRAEIALPELPIVEGNLLVFGRQTDREAHVVLIAYRGEKLASTRATLREIAGEELAAESSQEKVIDRTSQLQLALRFTRYLPDSTTQEKFAILRKEFLRDAIFESVPKLPLSALQGKTLQDAASDPGLRIKALAVILMLEHQAQWATLGLDFNQLRSQLGLPTVEPISGSEIDADYLPLTRMTRMVVEELSDDLLEELFHRAVLTQFSAAINRFGPELVRRENLTETVDKAEAYAILSRHANSSDEAVEYLAKARAAAVIQHESPVRWYLEELVLRFERGEVREAEQILHEVQDKHFHEPGVKEMLDRLLAQILNAGNRSASGPEPAEMAATPQVAESKLWTPESEQRSGGKLWTPD